MEFKVAVVGLGYVGLPLAVASGKKYPTIGFDIHQRRIAELTGGNDRTREVDQEDLRSAAYLSFTSQPEALVDANFYIITVPTPVDENRRPDLTFLQEASMLVAGVLKPGDIVVYESTVFPGCTEEVCVPILEKGSGLKFNKDFFCGYSPERINPGDKSHRLEDILKVTSGSDGHTAKSVDRFYASIIPAGTYLTSGIRVAEAAKVIENSQRDLNIAFVNELSLIFEKIGIDTLEVLEAAGTKWNFLKFLPGLVGGHCIGVDPYYLTHKAEALGYHPQVILSGRRINDNMGNYIAQRTVKLLSRKKQLNADVRVLILGITFKENCPDVRNSRVIDIYAEFRSYDFKVDVYDPLADQVEVKEAYGIELISAPGFESCDAVVLAVPHEEFKEYDWTAIRKKTSVIFDVKGVLNKELIDARL